MNQLSLFEEEVWQPKKKKRKRSTPTTSHGYQYQKQRQKGSSSQESQQREIRSTSKFSMTQRPEKLLEFWKKVKIPDTPLAAERMEAYYLEVRKLEKVEAKLWSEYRRTKDKKSKARILGQHTKVLDSLGLLHRRHHDYLLKENGR